MKFVGSLHFMAFGTFVEHLTTREKIANIPTAALLLTKPEIKFSEIAWNAWETLRILRMEVFSAVELDVFRVFTKFNTDVKWNCAEHTWNAVYFSIFFFWFIQFRYHSSTLPIFSSFCLDLLFSRCGYDKAKHIIHKIFLCDSHADDCWIFDRNPNQKKTSQIIHSALVFYSVVAPLFSRSSAKFIIQNLASKIIYCFSVGTKHHTT